MFGVRGFGWVWVGLGHGSISSPGSGLGWVGSLIWWVGLGWVDENRPTDNSGVGAVPSPWGFPQKKNQFCAKKLCNSEQVLEFFLILQHKNFQHAKIVTSASEKVGGGIIPSPESGGPIPLPPCSDAYEYNSKLSVRRLGVMWAGQKGNIAELNCPTVYRLLIIVFLQWCRQLTRGLLC